jgi:carbamoyltransferase
MKTLGISGKYRDAAAALAVDGQVVAAAAEAGFARIANVGYSMTGGAPLRAVGACLQAADLDADELDEIVIVAEDGAEENMAPATVPELLGATMPRARHRHVSAVDADALQAAAAWPGDSAVLVCSVEPPALVAFERGAGRLGRASRLNGADRLLCAGKMFARALGADGVDPFASLDRTTPAEPEFLDLVRDAIVWSDSSGVSIDTALIGAVIDTVRERAGGDLSGPAGHNVRLEHARHELAASVRTRIAEVLHAAARHACRLHGADSLALGGSMFAHAQLNTELRRLFDGDLATAFVPESAGRALGAALASSSADERKADGVGPVGRLDGVAIGPAFSDSDIKRTLDNCRLDYVYEPDWRRLLDRTSKLLSQGKVVAWFQGPMAFGPRPLGSRSILCDPSLRYSRENMNEYLRQVPLDEPLPVAFAPASAAESPTIVGSTPVGPHDAAVAPTVRDRLRAALDGRQRVRVNSRADGVGSELRELLDFHYARTRVPGLIETTLSAAGEPVACTPRDAVKTVYSSAIDALIIGRFVLMKDYWLLRSDVGA